MTQKEMLSASAAAEILGVSETAIRKRIKAGTLSATKEGGIWQIPREEIENLSGEPNPNRTAASNQTEPNPESSSHDLEILQTKLNSYQRENDQLQKQVEYLQTQNDHLTQLVAVAQKSVGQLTEQNQFLLEDTRKKKFWRRILRRDHES